MLPKEDRVTELDRDRPEIAWRGKGVAPSVSIRVPAVSLDVEAFEALQRVALVLERYFPNCEVIIQPRTLAGLARESAAFQVATKAPASIRGKVLAATKDIPATVEGIAKVTGLDPKKIRGVLTAPDLEFTTDRVGGVVAYKFVRTKERKRTKKPAAQNGEP